MCTSYYHSNTLRVTFDRDACALKVLEIYILFHSFVKIIIYLIAYANILTVRTYVLKTRTYDKMQTEIFKVGPNYL